MQCPGLCRGRIPSSGSVREIEEPARGTRPEHKLNGNRLFYLATPPDIYPAIIEHLDKAGLAKNPNGKSWTRIIIEKPYGRDLASARELNQTVLEAFDESQVFRIDHYLGKEPSKTLWCCGLATAFSSRCGTAIMWTMCKLPLGKLWGSSTRGVLRNRGRDARHDPEPCSAAHFAGGHGASGRLRCHRRSKRKNQSSAIHSAVYAGKHREGYRPRTIRPGKWPGDSSLLAGYQEEPGVAKNSPRKRLSPKLQIDNWRWAGVPFYLRTGKRLPSASPKSPSNFAARRTWCSAARIFPQMRWC